MKKTIVMAGLLTRPPSKRTSVRAKDSFRRADARRLGGRLKWPAMTEMRLMARAVRGAQ